MPILTITLLQNGELPYYWEVYDAQIHDHVTLLAFDKPPNMLMKAHSPCYN